MSIIQLFLFAMGLMALMVLDLYLLLHLLV